ncbi:alpha/beta hydrolase family protein [Microtetraspora niveoalba]|uniref:alpha/beta hydrolase family protein n=1 Tax=Microtetraspora niveoalba TaxID=46175 RepID=UPI000835E5A9|nr:alpha/beta hydrolase [Microtetraspora niveoalba]
MTPPTPSRSRRAAALALAALTAVTIGAGAGTAARADATSTGARAGASGVAPGPRGKIVSIRPLTNSAALPSAARNWYVTYVSEGAAGTAITVSGTVAVPRTPPPPGGWPVISWAHGTTGTADVCAPSADTPAGPVHDYMSVTSATLDAWVARGFAVVQTDYEGLGTPGEHPYMNGRSAANTVLDMVRAARKADRRIGRDWFAAGHSQGGHAALFSAALSAAAKSARKDVNLSGAVAIAPGGWAQSTIAPYIQTGQPQAAAAVAFLPTMLIGAAAADASVEPDALLTPQAAPLLTAARAGCLAQIREVAATIPVDKVFAPGADLGPLTRYLKSQEPVGLTLGVPTLVAQGTADVLVSRPTTDLMVADMCARARKVTYKIYEGADHRAAIARSFDDALSFVNSIRAGKTPQSTC